MFMAVMMTGSAFIENEPIENNASGAPISLMNKNERPCSSGRCERKEYAAMKKGIWMSSPNEERNAMMGL